MIGPDVKELRVVARLGTMRLSEMWLNMMSKFGPLFPKIAVNEAPQNTIDEVREKGFIEAMDGKTLITQARRVGKEIEITISEVVLEDKAEGGES